MSRASLFTVLFLMGVTGLILGCDPKLDLLIADLFFDHHKHDFMLRLDPLLGRLRDLSMWVVAALVVPSAIVLAAKLLNTRVRLPMSSRAAIFLLMTFALGPGLLVNVLLKNEWSRPRPIDVAEFGGNEHFVAWWDWRGDCPKNCSFVAGEGSAAFWTLAPAALTPLPLRPLAFGAAIAFGTAVSLLRMAFGAHFASDVIFAGIFDFLIVWATHRLVFRRS